MRGAAEELGLEGMGAEPEEVGLSSERLDRIDGWIGGYIEAGRIPGASILVARLGRVAYFRCFGARDREAAQPMTADTIFRIYSMTKPITSVALMMLYEEGRFQLDDKVEKFIPEFEGIEVYRDGTAGAYRTRPPMRPMTIRDLLSHTSGLTVGQRGEHPVNRLYHAAGIFGSNSKGTLKELVAKLGKLPLLFDPGTQWHYSAATDVCGYLVEVISAQRFDDYLEDRIFRPLGMPDTGFYVSGKDHGRLAANYAAEAGGMRLIDPPAKSRYLAPRDYLSGGGGLVSTARDYLRFSEMLRRKGELDGVRILGRKTVEFMTRNHMPGGVDLAGMGQPVFGETSYEGIGFGLGFSVMLDPAKAQVMGSPGEYAWGGAASTGYWIDPVEEMVVIFLTQLMPSSTYPFRRELKVLTYQALID